MISTWELENNIEMFRLRNVLDFYLYFLVETCKKVTAMNR
jgi:hypothetical protein